MKRILAFTTVACALALTSLNVYAKGATTSHNNQIIPIAETQFNECTGENVHYTYSMHFTSHSVTNKKKTSTKLHINYQNFHGVGVISGIEYSGNIVQNLRTTVDFEGSETTTKTHIVVTAQGTENNLKFSSTVRTTVDENGEVTSEVTSSGIECQ